MLDLLIFVTIVSFWISFGFFVNKQDHPSITPQAVDRDVFAHLADELVEEHPEVISLSLVLCTACQEDSVASCSRCLKIEK